MNNSNLKVESIFVFCKKQKNNNNEYLAHLILILYHKHIRHCL